MLAHLKNQFDERKTGLTVQKFGLRRLQRLDTIHEEPPSFFILPSIRKKTKARSCAGRVYLALPRKTTETDWKTRPTLFRGHNKIIRKEMICEGRRTQKKLSEFQMGNN